MIRLRVDDFPGTKPDEFWRHNLDNYKRFHDIVIKRVPEYVLGVIPRHTTDDHLRWLGQQQEIIVALHGVHHDERFPNEFRDFQTEEDIYQALLSAKRPLDELVGPVKTYIPPHNVFDQKTCRALERAGFKNICGGPGSPPWAGSNLNYFYSAEPLEYGRSDELRQRGSVEYLEKTDAVLTLHWTWEWNIGLENLQRYLFQLEGLFAPWEDA